MGLRTKFNWVVITCLLMGFFAIYWLHRNNTLIHTEMDLLHQAEQLFQISESIRAYNSEEVSPLLSNNIEGFTPQSISSYAVSKIFINVNEKTPTISYKVAIDDSEIQLYQPTVWQKNIISQFRNNPKLPLLTDKVADAKGSFLVYAKPIFSEAEVSGAKIIRIDQQAILQAVNDSLFKFTLILALIFIIIVLVINLMLHTLVLKPIKKLTSQAEKISQGEADSEELVITGKDEINRIAMAFNRMQRSLKAAMSMLS